jgi:methyl-accepting chemotaxis protein
MTKGAEKAFEVRILSAMDSAMRQVLADMREELKLLANDVLAANAQSWLEQATRTANSAEVAYESVKQIGAAVEVLSKAHEQTESVVRHLVEQITRVDKMITTIGDQVARLSKTMSGVASANARHEDKIAQILERCQTCGEMKVKAVGG